jgi:hypothetical protein
MLLKSSEKLPLPKPPHPPTSSRAGTPCTCHAPHPARPPKLQERCCAAGDLGSVAGARPGPRAAAAGSSPAAAAAVAAAAHVGIGSHGVGPAFHQAQSLDDLNEHSRPVAQRLGEQLQQHTLHRTTPPAVTAGARVGASVPVWVARRPACVLASWPPPPLAQLGPCCPGPAASHPTGGRVPKAAQSDGAALLPCPWLEQPAAARLSLKLPRP